MAVLGVTRRHHAGRHPLTAVALVGLLALGGCAGEADRARSAGARLSQVEGVAQAEVDPPGDDRLARLSVMVEPDITAAVAGSVLAAMAEAAQNAGYVSYTLEIARGDGDLLLADESLVDEPRRIALLRGWLRLADALDGGLVLDRTSAGNVVQVSAETVALDLAEAADVELPGPRTEWRFSTDDGSLALVGNPTDADLRAARRVPATVTSPGLPLPADRWGLGRFDGGYQLDLWLRVPGADAPADLSPRRFGERIAPLARGALEALRPARSVTLRLHAGGEDPGGADDLFGWWSTSGTAEPGRDLLGRGWDAWLRDLLEPRDDRTRPVRGR
ncbi:hypothetical protein [Nocardioides ferulae]|uniref:hypothetical protein n=1 Tax=Nocardioides ferulae TaxID=2340821 RepID=UPI000EB5A39A|nr:hypothetical protein [Nocardioides ferulae]